MHVQLSIGTDIIEVSRVRKAIEEYGERFLKRIYTSTEIKYCEQFGDKKYLHYAARFAAKEAFSKAIGTGIGEGFKFQEIGIINQESGKPIIKLEGSMLENWREYFLNISLSHTEENAVAFVLIYKKNL